MLDVIGSLVSQTPAGRTEPAAENVARNWWKVVLNAVPSHIMAGQSESVPGAASADAQRPYRSKKKKP